MILAFSLSMPGRSSWNGKWSGEGRPYVIVRSLRNKRDAERIIQKGAYRHAWNDGWTACVSVRAVDSKEASRLRRKSAGFCGYDWMVNNIIDCGATTPEAKP